MWMSRECGLAKAKRAQRMNSLGLSRCVEHVQMKTFYTHASFP